MHTALETALGKFEAMNDRGLQFRGKHANVRDNQLTPRRLPLRHDRR
jgi:hypothetical protein